MYKNQRNKKKNSWLLIASSLFFSGSVSAVEWAFDGFGSVVVGKTISDEPLQGGEKSTYRVGVPYSREDDGSTNADASYDDDWSVLPDSNVAFQLTALFNQDFSATMQLVGQGATRFDPEIEWAYLSYNLNPKLNIKAGRLRTPFYYYSDFLDVGYAYHWIRPPVDIYGEGASVYEGGQVNYKTALADFDLGIKAWYGKIENDNAERWRARVDNVGGLVFSVSRDWLDIRASYHTGDAYSDTDHVLTSPAKVTSKDNPTDAEFFSLGFMADFEEYFIGADLTRVRLDPYQEIIIPNTNPNPKYPHPTTIMEQGDRDAFMITAGYRFGDFTLHGTYSGRDVEMALPKNPQLSNWVDKNRRSITAGVRWDFYDNFALKAEVTQAKDHSDAIAKQIQGETLENTVFAIGIDYIF